MEDITISQELQEKIAAAKDLDEVVQICAKAGIAVTKEQLEAAMIPPQAGELDEDALSNVTGGGMFSWVRSIISAVGGGSGAFGGGGRMGGR